MFTKLLQKVKFSSRAKAQSNGGVAPSSADSVSDERERIQTRSLYELRKELIQDKVISTNTGIIRGLELFELH